MAQAGRYYGGHQFVRIGASGTRITSTTPPSQVVSGTQRHGMRQIVNWTGAFPSGVGPATQPYDARTDNLGGGGPISYASADNLNPGATGSPLTITTPCAVVQALSVTPLPSDRNFLKRRDVLFFIDHAPATDALPPPVGAVPLTSRYTKASISLASFPTLTPATGAPSPEQLLERIRWYTNAEFTRRPSGDYYVGSDYENYYASEQARTYSDVALALCSNITTTTRELLAAHVVIHAQNTVEVLNAGGRYNTNGGLGGILAGRKLFVVLASILTGDAYFTAWANRTDWAAEDRQCVYVSAQQVTDYDYEALDQGMPEWMQNPVGQPSANTRVLGVSYRDVFERHHIGQALACMMVTGAKAAWSNNAFFDLADRYMERTAYNGSGTNQWARTLTGTNAPSEYHKAFWTAQRSAGGMPAIWNW